MYISDMYCLSVCIYIEGVVSSRGSHLHIAYSDLCLQFLLMSSN